MRFSSALAHFENGAIIARARWNRDVRENDYNALSFIYMQKTNERGVMPDCMIATGKFEDEDTTILPHPMKKNRANLYSIWLPTVEDMCARDWYVVDLDKKDWQTVCGNFKNYHNNSNNNRNTPAQDSEEG